jgi:hypothetical protein
VAKRSCLVIAAIAGISENGSRIGLSSRNPRSPSAVYEYLVSDAVG